jgi:hypothetical protein
VTVFGSCFLSHGSPMLGLDPGEVGALRRPAARGEWLYRGFTLGTLSMAADRCSA